MKLLPLGSRKRFHLSGDNFTQKEDQFGVHGFRSAFIPLGGDSQKGMERPSEKLPEEWDSWNPMAKVGEPQLRSFTHTDSCFLSRVLTGVLPEGGDRNPNSWIFILLGLS